MNKVVFEEFEIFCGKDIKQDDWLWCNHCHRCYKANEFRRLREKGKIFLLCHYEDCYGDLPIDSRPWTKLISDRARLPQVPEKGTVYPIDPNHEKR